MNTISDLYTLELSKDFAPFLIRGFADRECDAAASLAKGADNMRHRQFDDAANAAGPQMVVDDDQLHGRARINDEG